MSLSNQTFGFSLFKGVTYFQKILKSKSSISARGRY